MSDSGFNQIPASGSPQPQGKGFNGGHLVKIITLPDTLKNLSQATRIEGEVSQVRRDGIIRILTPEGDVDVQVKGRNQPQPGQRIEIEIPAGREPRQAKIRPAPQRPNTQQPPPQLQPQTQQPTVTPNRPNTYSSPPQHPTQTTATQTPVNVQQPLPNATQPTQVTAPPQNTTQQQPTPQSSQQPVTNPATQAQQANNSALQNLLQTTSQTTVTPQQTQNTNAPAIQNAAAPLTTGNTVRLLAIPPAQALDISQQTISNFTTQQITIPRVAFTASLIANNISNNITQNLINTIKTQPTFTLAKSSVIPQSTTVTPQLNSLPSIALPTTQPAPLTNFVQNQPVTTSPTQTTTQQNITISLQQPSTVQTFDSKGSIPAPVSITNTATIPASVNLNTIGTEKVLATLTSPQGQTVPTPAISPPTKAVPQPTAPITATLITASATGKTQNITVAERVQKIDIQIVKITPPEVTLNTPQNTPQVIPAKTTFTPPVISTNTATTTTAKVTGFTQNGLPLVTLQLPGSQLPQSFILQFNATNLKLGTQLQITGLNTTSTASVIQTPRATTALPPLFQNFQWPAIEELYQSLLQTNPQAAASLSRALPNAANPSQMGPAAMMFIAAIRAGDIGGWLGDKKIDLLQRVGRSNLISQITREAAAMSRGVVQESTSSEWRAVPLPMFWESEIQKIMLYTKHENPHNQQDDNQGKQTRFIFDLNLSRMGDVQLDGLLREKRLDLVIRTQNMMSTPMQETMRKAYMNALGHTSMTGEIHFQGNKSHWVHVLEGKEQLGVSV